MTDIRHWLEHNGLAKYAGVFEENELTLEVLPELTEDDLRELGLPMGPRKRLLKLMRDLEAPDPGSGEPASPSPDADPVSAEAERRQLTIMFCDLADSTALSQRLDAEELREVNRAYQDACTSAIERYEGYVARYMGDGVLAYFGYPRAHEDDAERAIRAGLGVVDAVSALAPAVGDSGRLVLEVRVGIATGPVVVGDLIGKGASRESAVVGETPNLAARLQALAAPNTVVISPNTRALAARRFEYEDLGPHALKGIAEKVRAWRAIAPSAAESRFEAARPAGLTPLVGREQEIALLLERWKQAKEGDGQVVLLSGEAGIGKSRIIESLRERTAGDGPVWLRYQCSPYHASSALHPVIEQLERAARFAPGDPAEVKLDKLESLLAAGTRDGKTDAALLAPLLSIASGERYPPLEMSPERQKELTLEALLGQLEALGRGRPVLFVYEDVHWADPTSLELLERTVGRAARLPALVAVTFRPEFTPPWTGYPHVTSLTLNRFTRGLAAALVDRVTGGKALPESVLARIVERTDGVPLFVEEITKAIVESGRLTEAPDRYELAGALSDVAIPATLHDSLMARLDRLGAVKEVAQTASAIGREFDCDLLAAVSSSGFADLRSALGQLVDAGLVFLQGQPEDGRYIFKHALVRDAAYGSLLKRTRRELHGRVAEILEHRFPERAAREPELLARHFTEADRPQQAAPRWRDAGRLASRRSAYAEAVHHFTDGLDALGPDGDDPAHRRAVLDMQTGLADSLAWSRGFAAPEVEAAYARARELCRRAGDAPELFGVLWGLWHFYDISGRMDEALELARELGDLAGASDGPGRRSQAHRALGETLLWRGEFARAREELERGAAVYVPGPDSLVPGGEVPAVSNRALDSTALWYLGFPDRALERAAEALALARGTGNAGDQGMTLGFMAWIHLLRREPEATRDWAEQLLDFATERGMIFFEAFATVFLGSTLASLDSADEGVLRIVRGMETTEAIGAKVFLGWYSGLLADAQLAADRPEEARAVLGRARRLVEATGTVWSAAELHRLEAAALRRMDDPAGAEASLERALGVARAQGARSLELRACTDLAHLWREQGKPRPGRELLSPVLDGFTEGFEAPDLVAARALLGDLS